MREVGREKERNNPPTPRKKERKKKEKKSKSRQLYSVWISNDPHLPQSLQLVFQSKSVLWIHLAVEAYILCMLTARLCFPPSDRTMSINHSNPASLIFSILWCLNPSAPQSGTPLLRLDEFVSPSGLFQRQVTLWLDIGTVETSSPPYPPHTPPTDDRPIAWALVPLLVSI